MLVLEGPKVTRNVVWHQFSLSVSPPDHFYFCGVGVKVETETKGEQMPDSLCWTSLCLLSEQRDRKREREKGKKSKLFQGAGKKWELPKRAEHFQAGLGLDRG